MYVLLSRAIAAAGWPVLRFDFSGIGDSYKEVEDGLNPLESNLAEIKEAIDWLETTQGKRRFILVGLCSGADYSIHYSPNDPRVVGMVLMDPAMPPTKRYVRDYILQRLLRPRSWLNIAFGSSWLRHMTIEFIMSRFKPKTIRKLRTVAHKSRRMVLEQAYQASVTRGVKFLLIATGNSMQTYPEQLQEAFPNVSFGNTIRTEIFKNSDHIFTSEVDRMDLQKLLLHWLQESDFGPAVGVGPSDTKVQEPGKHPDLVCDIHSSNSF